MQIHSTYTKLSVVPYYLLTEVCKSNIKSLFDKKCNYKKEVEYLRLTCAVREAKTLYTSILKTKMTLNEFNLMRNMFN